MDGLKFKSMLDTILFRERSVMQVKPHNVFVHPNYNPELFMDDIGLCLRLFIIRTGYWMDFNCKFDWIALLRLPERVQFSQNIQPVQMPSSCDLPESDDVIAMGFGVTHPNATQENALVTKLMFAQLKMLPSHVCREHMLFIYRESIICASNESHKQSISYGDSGGPLVSATNRNLIGITSIFRPGTLFNWAYCWDNDR